MNERAGRVDEIMGETVEEMIDLPIRYPGGEHFRSFNAQSWLEENFVDSSNHPVQDLPEILSILKSRPESSTLLGSLLLGMAVTRGEEEDNSSR
jgi:hypothetical protein